MSIKDSQPEEEDKEPAFVQILGLEPNMLKRHIREAVLQFETPLYVDYNKETSICIVRFLNKTHRD